MADGAVVALIIAGADVNLPELAVLGGVLSRRVLADVVAAVFLTAIVGGYATPCRDLTPTPPRVAARADRQQR